MYKNEKEFKKSLKYGDNTPFVGTKFWETRHLEIQEISKLIRNDLKDLPVKSSVRLHRFSRGVSIHVKVLNKNLSKNAKSILERIIYAILDCYSFDGGNSQYDYSCNRFYRSVMFTEVL